MIRGKFITLEGGEGVGKTTNMKYVQQLLENTGRSVVVTREPGGTGMAEKIRDILLDRQSEGMTPVTELLLMFAARSQHIVHVIEPALQRGQWVLCDRFTDATFAYQGGGRGMDVETIAWLEQCVQGELRPDLTLLLDAPVATGMGRAQRRGDFDRFEQEQVEFFERVRQVYLQRARLNQRRFKIIDAAQSLDCVQKNIAEAIAVLS
ncbi:dTMP kinase [Methylomarinum vadi]|uniref:dTMP kinase n=1 Tax=Methylomarinum vadi TaxID=438855 RepID=UPI0004DF3957|nr:dTMP kinase [Methylomarinum vadi]